MSDSISSISPQNAPIAYPLRRGVQAPLPLQRSLKPSADNPTTFPLTREAEGPFPLNRSTDPLAASTPDGGPNSPDKLKEAFTDFVGQTLFGSMLASMRSTVGKPAYLHGGRMEETFQKQLDQHIVEDLTESSASSIANPMFELFQLRRQ
ncbi:MAG: rod-binding protein [Planctomycetota bacterium]